MKISRLCPPLSNTIPSHSLLLLTPTSGTSLPECAISLFGYLGFLRGVPHEQGSAENHQPAAARFCCILNTVRRYLIDALNLRLLILLEVIVKFSDPVIPHTNLKPDQKVCIREHEKMLFGSQGQELNLKID